MTKTSTCFLEECYKLNMPIPSKATETRVPVHMSKDRAATIIQSFKSASRLTFMKVIEDTMVKRNPKFYVFPARGVYSKATLNFFFFLRRQKTFCFLENYIMYHC